MLGCHKLPYKCTVYSDGCGSMVHVEIAAVMMGLDHAYIPPHEQSLNEAERIADRAFACARVYLIDSGALPSHFAMALDFTCYMKLRMATTASRNWLTPHEILRNARPSIQHCMPWYTTTHVTVPQGKSKKLER
mgnify:CR=1 FL=1